jgi:hypothetical protein
MGDLRRALWKPRGGVEERTEASTVGASRKSDEKKDQCDRRLLRHCSADVQRPRVALDWAQCHGAVFRSGSFPLTDEVPVFDLGLLRRSRATTQPATRDQYRLWGAGVTWFPGFHLTLTRWLPANRPDRPIVFLTLGGVPAARRKWCDARASHLTACSGFGARRRDRGNARRLGVPWDGADCRVIATETRVPFAQFPKPRLTGSDDLGVEYYATHRRLASHRRTVAMGNRKQTSALVTFAGQPAAEAFAWVRW